MFPKLLIVTVKGEKSRSEIMTPMGNQVDITDYATKTKIGLFDIMGQKYAIKSHSRGHSIKRWLRSPRAHSVKPRNKNGCRISLQEGYRHCRRQGD